MKLNNITYVRTGHYSIGDLKDYFSSLRKKYEEEREFRQAQSEVTSHIKDSINSYKKLLETINKKNHPELHGNLEQTIIKMENLIKEYEAS